jgi:hypothetical protein
MTQKSPRDEWDCPPDVTDLGHAIDRTILKQTDGNLSPAVKIAFDGALGIHDLPRIQDALAGIEIVAPHRQSPVDGLRANHRNPLLDWEWLAAQRFRVDFDIAHTAGGTVNYERMGMFDTDLARKHRAAGYSGKGASRVASASGLADARLDAMQRRGAFAAQNRMSFWLAEAIVGFELWPKDVARVLKENPDYVGRRFREALHDLAGFYRMHAVGPKTGKTRAWHNPEAVEQAA